MKRVADGAARELMGHKLSVFELCVQCLGTLGVDDHRLAFAQSVPEQKVLRNPCLDVNQCLVDPDHMRAVRCAVHSRSVQERIARKDREVVLGLALTWKLHGATRTGKPRA